MNGGLRQVEQILVQGHPTRKRVEPNWLNLIRNMRF